VRENEGGGLPAVLSAATMAAVSNRGTTLRLAKSVALEFSDMTPGTATYSLPMPNITGLIGLHVYLQSWAFAPGGNPGQTIVSNGIEWVIGNS